MSSISTITLTFQFEPEDEFHRLHSIIPEVASTDPDFHPENITEAFAQSDEYWIDIASDILTAMGGQPVFYDEE